MLRTLQDLCLDFKETVPSQEDFEEFDVPSQEDFEEFDEKFWKSLEEVHRTRIYGFQVFYAEFLWISVHRYSSRRSAVQIFSAAPVRLRCIACSSAGFTASTFAVVCGGCVAWGSWGNMADWTLDTAILMVTTWENDDEPVDGMKCPIFTGTNPYLIIVAFVWSVPDLQHYELCSFCGRLGWSFGKLGFDVFWLHDDIKKIHVHTYKSSGSQEFECTIHNFKIVDRKITGVKHATYIYLLSLRDTSWKQGANTRTCYIHILGTVLERHLQLGWESADALVSEAGTTWYNCGKISRHGFSLAPCQKWGPKRVTSLVGQGGTRWN